MYGQMLTITIIIAIRKSSWFPSDQWITILLFIFCEKG
jgi:hypothetical protein